MSEALALRAPTVPRNLKADNGINARRALRAQGNRRDQRKEGWTPNPAKFEALGDSQPTTFDMLPARRCRWPIGIDGRDLTCCGAAAEDGAYCPTHQQMSRDPGETKRVDRYLFKKRRIL